MEKFLPLFKIERSIECHDLSENVAKFSIKLKENLFLF